MAGRDSLTRLFSLAASCVRDVMNWLMSVGLVTVERLWAKPIAVKSATTVEKSSLFAIAFRLTQTLLQVTYWVRIIFALVKSDKNEPR